MTRAADRSKCKSTELQPGGNFLLRALKAVLRPWVKLSRRILVEPVLWEFRRSVNESLLRNESHTRWIEEHFGARLKDITFRLGMGDPDSDVQRSDILVSNGLIDAPSYLDKAMEGETESLKDLKSAYGEDAAYYLFEKLFRGSESDIAKRQGAYMGHILDSHAKISAGGAPGPFLDIGCGRGEFLALMKDAGLDCVGVDMSRFNFDKCKKSGFRIVCDDGNSYLKTLPDSSLSGISMFQVAEHLPYSGVKEFISLAYDKIQPGGMILIETINPSCDFSMKYFYLDPTHIRPYPPETLRFLAEWEGFGEMKIIFYIPIRRYLDEADTSNYVGYALVGRKPF